MKLAIVCFFLKKKIWIGLKSYYHTVKNKYNFTLDLVAAELRLVLE